MRSEKSVFLNNYVGWGDLSQNRLHFWGRYAFGMSSEWYRNDIGMTSGSF